MSATNQDVRTVGQADGCVRVTSLGEDLATGITKLYSSKLSVPDEGITYTTDTLISKKRDTTPVYDCKGEFVGLQKGNQQYEEKTMDITFADDFNWANNDYDPTISRTQIKALMDVSSWKDGANSITGLGTNGVRNIVTYDNTNDFKNLLLEDGKLKNPNLKLADGSLSLVTNNAVSAYKDTNCVMIEFKYAFQSSYADTKGDRFPYLLCETPGFNEGSGSDWNKMSVAGTRYCDSRDIDRYFIQGVTNAEDVSGSPASSENALRIGQASNGVITGNVLFGSVDTTDSVISTITLTNGTAGDIIVLVGDGANAGDNNEIFIFVVSDPTTATAINANYNLTSGANIFVTQRLAGLVTATSAVVIDASSATDQYGYVNITTAGASGSAVPTNWKTNPSGSGDDTFVLDIRDWDFGTRLYIDYTGVEV